MLFRFHVVRSVAESSLNQLIITKVDICFILNVIQPMHIDCGRPPV